MHNYSLHQICTVPIDSNQDTKIHFKNIDFYRHLTFQKLIFSLLQDNSKTLFVSIYPINTTTMIADSKRYVPYRWNKGFAIKHAASSIKHTALTAGEVLVGERC